MINGLQSSNGSGSNSSSMGAQNGVKKDEPSSPTLSSPAGGVNGSSRTNLIINYLPQTMSNDEVQQMFSAVGELASCKLVKDKITSMCVLIFIVQHHFVDQSLGYAFVNYVHVEDAAKAVANMNGLHIQNKTIKVSYARPSSETIKNANLYVSGLPKDYTQHDLEALFHEFGDIITSRLLTDTVTGESKGVGFVRYDKRSEAEAAITKLNNTKPDNDCSETLTVKYANIPPPGGKSPQAYAPVSGGQWGMNGAGIKGRAYGGGMRVPRMPMMVPQQPSVVTHLTGVTAAHYPYMAGRAGYRPAQATGSMHHSSQQGRNFRYSPLTTANGISNGAVNGGAYASTGGANALLSLTGAAPIHYGLPHSAYSIDQGNAGSPTGGQCIFVYNLPPDADDTTMWQLFGPFGAVLNVKVIRDVTNGNKCKGYGFVTMAHYDEATVAISQLNGTHMPHGRHLQVSFKSAKK